MEQIFSDIAIWYLIIKTLLCPKLYFVLLPISLHWADNMINAQSTVVFGRWIFGNLVLPVWIVSLSAWPRTTNQVIQDGVFYMQCCWRAGRVLWSRKCQNQLLQVWASPWCAAVWMAQCSAMGFLLGDGHQNKRFWRSCPVRCPTKIVLSIILAYWTKQIRKESSLSCPLLA